MAEKMYSLILKVDLDCHLCYKKIRKTLCKLQDCENIRGIVYDEKNNTVTVSGPFDPQRLSKKLRCKACKVIKEIQIKEIVPKETPKDTQKDKPPEKKEKEKDKPKTSDQAPKAAPKVDPPKIEPQTLKPETEKPKKPPAVVQGPDLVYLPVQPVWPAGPVCHCRPYCEGYYSGWCRCGRGYGPYGWVAGGPPCPDAYNIKTCHFFCEEESSCRIM